MVKFSFKSNVNYDIALLSEVEELNPYAFQIEQPIWDDIALDLVASELKMSVTGRSCKDRANLLLKDFSKEEAISKRLSGVDEGDLKTITFLLTSIAKLRNDVDCKNLKRLYSKKNREEAKKTRESALANLEKEMDSEIIVEDEDLDFEQQGGSDAIPSSLHCSNSKPINEVKSNDAEKRKPKDFPEPNSKRTGRTDAMSYLKEKHETEMNYKYEELKIRAKEAENKQLELTLERDRLKEESEIKRLEIDLAKQLNLKKELQ